MFFHYVLSFVWVIYHMSLDPLLISIAEFLLENYKEEKSVSFNILLDIYLAVESRETERKTYWLSQSILCRPSHSCGASPWTIRCTRIITMQTWDHTGDCSSCLRMRNMTYGVSLALNLPEAKWRNKDWVWAWLAGVQLGHADSVRLPSMRQQRTRLARLSRLLKRNIASS